MADEKKLTREEHIERHKKLHAAFDELAADFLEHNPERRLTQTTLMQLMEWSHAQTISPTERTQ